MSSDSARAVASRRISSSQPGIRRFCFSGAADVVAMPGLYPWVPAIHAVMPGTARVAVLPGGWRASRTRLRCSRLSVGGTTDNGMTGHRPSCAPRGGSWRCTGRTGSRHAASSRWAGRTAVRRGGRCRDACAPCWPAARATAASSTTTPPPRATPARAPGPARRPSGDAGTEAYAVAAPGPLETASTAPTCSSGRPRPLPKALVERVRAVTGVQAVLPISLASASIEGRTLDVAAVDPAKFRRFTPDASAQAEFVWKRLAGGEVVVDTGVGRRSSSARAT